MGLSTSKTKTTSNSNSNQTATTTPNLPGNLQIGLNGVIDKTNGLAGVDPYSTVAGPSPLQNRAFYSAGSLGGGSGVNWGGNRPNYADDSGMRQRSSPAPQVGQSAMPSDPGTPSMAPADGSSLSAQLGYVGSPSRFDPNGSSQNGWQGAIQRSSDLAGKVAGSGPNTAGVFGYQAPNIDPTSLGAPSLYGGTQLGSAPQGSATSFNAPQIGATQGYSSYQLGNAPQVGGVNIGGAHTYDAAQMGIPGLGSAAQAAAVNLDPAAHSTALQAQSTDASGLISKFLNPYTDNVVNSTLSDYDVNASRQRDQMEAAAGAAHAFGGSGYGLALSQLGGEQARGRATTDANLRSQGFSTALGAALQQSGQDTGVNVGNADRFTQNNQFNAQTDNTRSLTQGQMDQQRNLANAGFTNDNMIAGANMALQGGMANLNATNTARQFGANAGNNRDLAQAGYDMQGQLANQDVNSRFALDQAGRNDQASAFGALANNNRTMAQGQNDYGAASQSNQNINQFASQNLGLQGQYGLQQGQFDQQAGLAGMDARNNFTLQQGSMDQQRRIAQAGMYADAGQFGANALNANGQFNANQRDNMQNRQLAAAGQFGQLGDSYANNQRGDIGLQASLGGQQRDIQQQYLNAPTDYLARLSQLYQSGNPMIGQTMNGTSQTSATGTSTSKPSIMDIWTKLAAAAAQAAAAGG